MFTGLIVSGTCSTDIDIKTVVKNVRCTARMMAVELSTFSQSIFSENCMRHREKTRLEPESLDVMPLQPHVFIVSYEGSVAALIS